MGVWLSVCMRGVGRRAHEVLVCMTDVHVCATEAGLCSAGRRDAGVEGVLL